VVYEEKKIPRARFPNGSEQEKKTKMVWKKAKRAENVDSTSILESLSIIGARPAWDL
jgi:hypothetical protein